MKTKNNIIIGSEGMGIWGKYFLEYILKQMGYTNISYNNTNDCDFIISSLFLNIEKPWNNKKKKYVYWSGESTPPPRNVHESKKLFMLTSLEDNIPENEFIYTPYFLYNPHTIKLYNNQKHTNTDRKYLVAYCSKNKKPMREDIFNLFVEKKGISVCHSLGRCCGNYPESRKMSIPGEWYDDKLIQAYKDYKFVFAIENGNRKGYITEKIINAYYSGAIPIYYGCEEINDFFNPKSFINVSSFDSLEDCVDYVINMKEEDILEMTKQKIFNEHNEIVNMLNENNNDNPVLKKYINLFNNFLEDS